MPIQQQNLCQVRTERLVFEEVLAEQQKQVVVRGIVDLDNLRKPPVVQIIDSFATARIISYEVVAEKVIFKGEIEVKIIYEAAMLDQPVYVAELVVPFSDFIDVRGLQPPAQVSLRVQIEDVSAELVKRPGETYARKISVTAVIKVYARVTQRREIDVVVDVTGPPGLQVQRETLRLRRAVAEGRRQVIVRDTVNLGQLGKPPFEQLIDAIGNVTVTDVRVLRDKILFEGTLEVKVLYATTRQQVFVVSQTMNFKDFVDVPGAMPGMDAELQVSVEHISVVAEDRDGDGAKETLIKSVVLSAVGRVFERQEIQVVVGVTGVPGIQVETVLVRAEEVIGETTAQVVVSDVISPSAQRKPCVKQVIDCRAFPKVTRTAIVGQKVIVDGQVEVKVIYESETQAAHVVHATFSFQAFAEVPGITENATITTDVRVVDVSCSIPPGAPCAEVPCPDVTVAVVLAVDIRAVQTTEMRVVTAVFCPGAPVAPGMVCEGMVTANQVNVRTGPGTEYPVIAQVNAGDRVTILEAVGDWRRVRITATGVEGYIFYRYVKCLEPLG